MTLSDDQSIDEFSEENIFRGVHSYSAFVDKGRTKQHSVSNDLEKYQIAGCWLAMRLLQSDLVLDETERDAVALFLTKENILRVMERTQTLTKGMIR